MINDRPDSEIFSQFAGELLASGRRLRFQAHGRSMVPVIEDGEILHVERAALKSLRRGDIVLFKKADEFKAHRILGKQGPLFITRGDAGMDTDGVIRGEQIMGRVVAKECLATGQSISLSGARARTGFFWRELRRSLALRRRLLHTLEHFPLAILFLILGSATVCAQVAVDHSASGSQLVTGGAGSIALTPVSLTVTASGTNRLLVVSVSFNTSGNAGSKVTGITYGTQSFNAVNSFNADPGNSFRIEMWYLVAPNTGTNNITVTITKAGGGGNKLGVVIGAVDFTGVDQSFPVRGFASSSGTSTTPSVTITSGTPEVVLDTVAAVASVTAAVPAGQTSRWNTASSGTPAGQNVRGVGSTAAGAASVTMTETLSASTAWTDVAISIRPPEADVSITKGGAPNPVLKNGTLTYTLTVSNSGPRPATVVAVSDTLPSQVAYVSSSSTQGTCTQAAGTVSCAIGTMASGATVTITITTTAVTPSEATNTATVTATSTDPLLTNNSASVTTLIEFPTAVNVNSFTANQGVSGALLSWKTGGELHNLGFNVYKEVNGEKVRLNSSLIAGSALLMREALPQHGAKTYGWIDHSPTAGGVYWLEDVDLNGTRTMHGPVSLQGASVAPVSEIRAATFADLSSNSLNRDSSLAHVRERIGRSPSGRTFVGFELAAKPAIKLFVDHEGWFNVTQPQLVAAGLDPNADARSLHLFAEGV